MIPVTYYAPSEPTSPRFAYAFARGCNGAVTDETALFPGPVALFATPSRWSVLTDAQASGRDWYYGDHGYFGRKHFYRVTKNAYQHDGRGDYPLDRWRHFGRWVYDWRKTGSHILVCPNSAVHFRCHGLDVDTWVADVCTTIRTHTDREIRIRWKHSAGSIGADLQDCWAVVVFSSAAALDALIVGVPVFVIAPWAAAARMGRSDLSQIESPVYPEGRESFLAALAYQQWTFSEMIQGVAWRALQEQEAYAATA